MRTGRDSGLELGATGAALADGCQNTDGTQKSDGRQTGCGQSGEGAAS
jgi:hypothetical protein